MKTIGILGGGQLGTMLGTAVADLGARVAFYDPDPDVPAARRFDDVTTAPWDDERAIAAFAARCDVVTYEMEHVSVSDALQNLAKRAILRPSLAVLETTQDRVREKEHLRRAGLPHVEFEVAEGATAARAIAARWPRPFIVKTTRGGYDGKGQIFVGDEADLAAVAALPEDGTYVFEESLPLVMEASCIVGRSPSHEVCFPVFENAHAEHILDVTLLPARLPSDVTQRLEALALETARSLDLHGLLTVEFFLTRAGAARSMGVLEGDLAVFVNELAPRPHNSGHVTRKACTASQFELLARILLDVPFAVPALVSSDAHCMGNLLGDVWLAQGGADLDLACLAEYPDVIELVLYGKTEARARRKMGHFTCRAPTAEAALRRAREFRAALGRPPARKVR
jgi:5-(carboxyamino)imidazole ribonucleotide synthase